MKNVIDYYSNFDEWGRLDREPLEFTINMHFIKKYLPTSGTVLDNGAGPGKYAMELAKLGYNVTLSDLTPKLVEIAEQKATDLELTQQFSGFHVLSATHLDVLADEIYDASLMLGPLYHLQKEEERISAVRELYRVTKKNGIIFIAFQSRIKKTITCLKYPQFWKPNDNMDAIKEFYENDGTFNHSDKGRFTGAYFFNIDEIKPFIESNGFETIDLIGSSSIASMLTDEQKQHWVDEGEYDKLINFYIAMANDPSVLGISSHLLYIGRRK